MERNLDLMIQVRDWAKAHPELHDQSEWRTVNCKTKMCVGGAAAEFAGGRWLTKNPEFMGNAGHLLVPEPDDGPGSIVKVYVGRLVRLGVPAPCRAQRVLGLTEEEAEALFLDADYASGAIEMLDEMIRKESERRRSAARRAVV